MYSHSHENIGFGLWDQFASLPNTNGNIGVLSTTKIYHEGETFAIMATSENATIDIYAVKLELGPVQTLAHKEGDTWVLNDPPPNKALELAKCQRYFCREETSIQIGANSSLTVFFPTQMRITPAITVSDSSLIIDNNMKGNKHFSIANPSSHLTSFVYTADANL